MPPPAPVYSLSYARPPRRRRLTPKGRFLAVITLALFAAGIWWFPRQMKVCRFLYCQRQSANYTLPLGTVVFDDTSRTTGVQAARPPCLSEIEPTASPGAAVLFLHVRCSPSGTRRIVQLDSAVIGLEEIGMKTSELVNWRFDGDVSPVVTVQTSQGLVILPEGASYPGLKVYAGQPDAADESRFTIAYEFGGQNGVMDGWLTDAGLVRLQERPGPAKMATWRPTVQ